MPARDGRSGKFFFVLQAIVVFYLKNSERLPPQ